MDNDDFEEYIANFREDLIDEGRPLDEVERLIQEEIEELDYQSDCAYERQKEEGVFNE